MADQQFSGSFYEKFESRPFNPKNTLLELRPLTLFRVRVWNCEKERRGSISQARAWGPLHPIKVMPRAHLRELTELGFEVAVVKDAPAAAILPEGDGYLAALTNFRFIANAVWNADQAIKELTSKP